MKERKKRKGEKERKKRKGEKERKKERMNERKKKDMRLTKSVSFKQSSPQVIFNFPE
jgi:hypothetical protein